MIHALAARGQIQLALDFPQNAKWVTLFRAWWREGFAAWQARHAGDGAGLVFLSELGPPDYALTNARGEEMSDRWGEALLLGQWAREIWGEVQSVRAA